MSELLKVVILSCFIISAIWIIFQIVLMNISGLPAYFIKKNFPIENYIFIAMNRILARKKRIGRNLFDYNILKYDIFEGNFRGDRDPVYYIFSSASPNKSKNISYWQTLGLSDQIRKSFIESLDK
jgi:hypothetical protein